MSEIGQLMESLFSIQESLSGIAGDMLNEIDSLREDRVPDDEILEDLNNSFTIEENKFSSVEDAIDYFFNLDI